MKTQENKFVNFNQHHKKNQLEISREHNMVKVPLVNVLADAEFAGKIYVGG